MDNTEIKASLICGVDEAGRGCLFGDVFAAAVIMPPGVYIDGITDSKKLSEKKRTALYHQIIDTALCYGIGRASPQEIEQFNILNASLLAMERAVDALPVDPDLVLVDGNRGFPCPFPLELIVKGDLTCYPISCASILAKVSRDTYIYSLDEQYGKYGISKHKGYGTKEHFEKIKLYGQSDLHRKGFLCAK